MPVKMYGLAFDDSGIFVERLVPAIDVQAYLNAGYQLGELPEELKPKPEAVTPEVTETPAKALPKRGRPSKG